MRAQRSRIRALDRRLRFAFSRRAFDALPLFLAQGTPRCKKSVANRVQSFGSGAVFLPKPTHLRKDRACLHRWSKGVRQAKPTASLVETTRDARSRRVPPHLSMFVLHCQVLQNDAEQPLFIKAPQVWTDRLGLANEEMMSAQGSTEALKTSVNVDVVDNNRPARP